MQDSDIFQRLRSYWANDRINYCVRVFIALTGVTLPAWYGNTIDQITPMVLGIIAAALAEVDDRLTGRIKAVLLMLLCFLIAALSIEILLPYPLLFALGLFISTMGFTMLGAMGPRYASIAFASLLLAVYTMLGAGQSNDIWTQPMLLLTGALWYSTLSLLWQIVWPNRPVQQGLAQVFHGLSDYLESKSELFDPMPDLSPQPYRLKLAKKNTLLVSALNQTKDSLLQRVRQRASLSDQVYLQIYFVAQDIHERISSSHYRYQDLASHFARSDVLFRFQKLLMILAGECREVSEALVMNRTYEPSGKAVLALDEIQQSIEHLKQQNQLQWRSLLIQLEYLLKNLSSVVLQLSSIGRPDMEADGDERILADFEPKGVKAHLKRIRDEFRFDSPLFRHGIRLAIALTAGYGLIQLLDLQPGYWVLLTTLFVSQPSFSATRAKLVQRVIGTIVGLLAGAPLLYLFPGQEGQLVLMVLCGVLFFAFRKVRYDLATAFITLLVLFCFSQQGLGFTVILPRLGDTLLGCVLAVIAVMFVLPDWESKRLNRIMASTIEMHRMYLKEVIEQYIHGRNNGVAYRVARRQAHNMDTKLNSAILSMHLEPERFQRAGEQCFRFLTLSSALLSYISTLGAHRDKLEDIQFKEEIQNIYLLINEHLLSLEKQLIGHVVERGDLSAIDRRLQENDDGIDEGQPEVRMLLQQFQLMTQILPEMHMLSDEIYQLLSSRKK
ncbi:YccS family putative transporter [Endozoicomonas ascidiicola]|uniref:YccS family putative transporter n=1 Tax=Endozoicomonas ascidiicola TaxID=1698521 RepID=UPI00082E861C|nr:YccS family putative transporter [Endozoicomonas ascidiicola]